MSERWVVTDSFLPQATEAPKINKIIYSVETDQGWIMSERNVLLYIYLKDKSLQMHGSNCYFYLSYQWRLKAR